MERVFIEDFDGETLGGTTFNHLKNVLRMRIGDIFAGYDGHYVWELRISNIQRSRISVAVISKEPIAEVPASGITIGAAVIKGGRWDWMLEKLTEIGVGKIVPILAERSVVKLNDAEEIDSKMSKWNRTLNSSSAQCSGIPPLLLAPTSLSDFFRITSNLSNKLIMAKNDVAVNISEAMKGDTGKSAAILVGPEGDWSEEELGSAISAGFIPVTTGVRILRSETAVVSAAAIASVLLNSEKN